MVESYDEYEKGEPSSADSPPLQNGSPRSSEMSPSFGSRPRDINNVVTNGNRAGNVFDSYNDLTRRGEDRKIPRQARPTILRKEIIEKKKLGAENICGDIGTNVNTEFRDRSQTAPILLRRNRERNTNMIEQKDNNNTEDSQDELVGVIEMPKTHSEAKKPQKHRFPFKKNREKENGIKDEGSISKSRARRARAEGQITPNKGEYTSQSDGGTLRARSSSTVSASTERRRRTRRRRGNRKSGSNTGLDAEMDQMSLEEALNALQSNDTREGQTWHENLGDENLQCQVINGTTYFTPVNQNKTKESDQSGGPMSLPSGTTFGDYEDEYASYGSPSSGSVRVSTATSGYAESSASGMYTLAVEEFKPRRQISQSEPMGSRSVKNDGQPSYSSEKLRAQLKEIWVQTESKKYLTPERFEHTRGTSPNSNNATIGADREVESMTALTAEETAKMILNESESKINENKISKLWETNIDKSSGQQLNDIWEPEKSISTRVSPVNDIWSPAPSDDIMAQMSSITLSAERHLGLPVVDTASTSTTSSGDIWRHDSLTSRGLITN